MKKCKDCEEEKDLSEFFKQGKWYRGRCKKCHGKRFWPPTGKLNTGRFREKHIPWNKCEESIIKRTRNYGSKERLWSSTVLEKNGNKCAECKSTEKLHAHHIIPWKDSEELRYEVSNGQILCSSCHAKLEGFQKGQTSPNKGKKFPGKINNGSFKKGSPSPRKGKKANKPVWNKGKYTAPEEKRKCVKCDKIKEIELFYIIGKYRRNACKECIRNYKFLKRLGHDSSK